MDIREARVRARTTMDDVGLKQWRLEFDARPRRRLGQCRYTTQTIGITRSLVELNPWDIVEQTLLHECAHALVGPEYGHGPVWRMKALELGVKRPSAARREPELKLAPAGPRGVDVVCPTHGVITSRTRMPKAGTRYRHNGCGMTVTFERKVGR